MQTDRAGGGIRTHDLAITNRLRYRTAPRQRASTSVRRQDHLTREGNAPSPRAIRGCGPLGPRRRGRVLAARVPFLLPAIPPRERVAGGGLVARDEDVAVDAAPPEAEARCRGKRVRVVRVHGVAVGRVRIAWSHSRSGEEGGRPEGQASVGEGGSGERDEQERQIGRASCREGGEVWVGA